jgi:hypothetical protein
MKITSKLALAFLTSFLFASSAIAGDSGYPDEEFIFWRSTIHGHKYLSGPSWEWIRNTPNWTPGNPLPITVEAAIASAKAELERHTPKKENWFFFYLDILSFRSGTKDKWYFLVEFGTFDDRTYPRARVPVNMSGVACKLFEDREERKNKGLA